jgi:hypothetical protein
MWKSIPTPIGDAFVAFNSSLGRRRFLDSPSLDVDGYYVSFEKHHKGDNAREYDMDREVWLMLLGYPIDARSKASIEKSIASFARHVHESDALLRIVIKISMNDEKLVPHK